VLFVFSGRLFRLTVFPFCGIIVAGENFGASRAWRGIPMDRNDKRFLSLLWLVVPVALAVLVCCVTAGYSIYRRAVERAYHETSWGGGNDLPF